MNDSLQAPYRATLRKKQAKVFIVAFVMMFFLAWALMWYMLASDAMENVKTRLQRANISYENIGLAGYPSDVAVRLRGTPYFATVTLGVNFSSTTLHGEFIYPDGNTMNTTCTRTDGEAGGILAAPWNWQGFFDAAERGLLKCDIPSGCAPCSALLQQVLRPTDSKQ